MALTNHYTIQYYTVCPKGISAKVLQETRDETGEVLRQTAFRAEYLEEAKLQDRANARGANATNKLSWHDADVEEEVKVWLANKRYPNTANVKMRTPPEAP